MPLALAQRRTRLVRLEWMLTRLALALVPFWLRVPVDLLPGSWYAVRHGIVLVLIGAMLVWALARFPGLTDLRRDRLRLAFALALALLTAWIAASTQWAFINFRRPDVALSGAAQWIVVSGFVILIACGRIHARALIGVWGAILIVISAIVIAQAGMQRSVGLHALGEPRYSLADGDPSILRAGELTFVRPPGLMPHPNLTAGALVAGALALAGWLLTAPRWRARAALVALPVVGFALLLTFSRGAWAGLAAGGLVALPWLWPSLRQHGRRVWIAGVLLGATG
ncbi:MAG: hypothetical protein NZM00_14050, partial [Anaerolinea sp.]|nr:hypothetical protein [Anaerolinea sp.]